MKHRRGNPNWGKQGELPLVIPLIAWELMLAANGIREADAAQSRVARDWAHRNRGRYIPEALLQGWGMSCE